ncbi:MAG: cyclase family protein [Pyrinomonadaceae bacterium]|nr:cyclase family protein [Pyrinomonadaceae bacterium]
MIIDLEKLGEPIDIWVPLRFDGQQPNAFGVDVATSKAIGDTREGASVNFEQYTFIPHCNGTHTECVGHITDERISVLDCLKDVFLTAVLVSVEPESDGEDRVLSLNSLRNAGVQPSATAGGTDSNATALIVRTLPNDDSKLTRLYGEGNVPPYFTVEAMEFIVTCGFRHLLVDMPSIDRMFDEGKLVNHRIFWNVEPGSREINAATRRTSTITELIYVPEEVADGEYLLNLQIAPFVSDAAPSRPVLFTT